MAVARAAVRAVAKAVVVRVEAKAVVATAADKAEAMAEEAMA